MRNFQGIIVTWTQTQWSFQTLMRLKCFLKSWCIVIEVSFMENNLLRTEQCSLTDPQVLLIVSVFVNNFRKNDNRFNSFVLKTKQQEAIQQLLTNLLELLDSLWFQISAILLMREEANDWISHVIYEKSLFVMPLFCET